MVPNHFFLASRHEVKLFHQGHWREPKGRRGSASWFQYIQTEVSECSFSTNHFQMRFMWPPLHGWLSPCLMGQITSDTWWHELEEHLHPLGHNHSLSTEFWISILGHGSYSRFIHSLDTIFQPWEYNLQFIYF